jgi:hypothetical protein
VVIFAGGEARTKTGARCSYSDGGVSQIGDISSLTFDSSGDMVAVESGQNAVWLITPDGGVINLAGNPTFNAGPNASGMVNGPAATAEFSSPQSAVTDAVGNVYVADYTNNCVRVIAPP